jgi:eukaryotic-like serine/threonine-protein kinase
MAEARAQNTYRVTERLESGGMAEVFRGESTSLAGFKRQVAIKRVLPHLASNEKFIRMFLDEARLSARLTHANIVQVFDIGHVENTYFIVMEFIDGVNLKAVIEFVRNRRQPFPLPLAVHVMIKVCEGLQYAHEATDSDNKNLNIVHRDISPPNILISKRGEVKIVDFGLAKAAHSVEKTEPGVVKGKFSYLAPETAMGEEADPQADLFAVGIMLWEMLAGRKLFQGETDYQTVKMVQQAVVPPIRTINSAVPEDLDKILRKALSKSKADRYRTSEQFSEELAEFLILHRLKATAADLSKLVADVMADRAASARQTARNEGNVIDQLIQEELLRFTSLGEPSVSPSGEVGPVTPAPAEDGSRPLNASEFVNLNDWGPDLADTGFDPGLSSAATWDQPGNRLSGVPGSLADELEGDAPDSAPPPRTPTPRPPSPSNTPVPVGSPQPPTSATIPIPLTQSARPPAQSPQPPAATPTAAGKKFPVAAVAVVAVVLAGVLGGLFAAGIIPH